MLGLFHKSFGQFLTFKVTVMLCFLCVEFIITSGLVSAPEWKGDGLDGQRGGFRGGFGCGCVAEAFAPLSKSDRAELQAQRQ